MRNITLTEDLILGKKIIPAGSTIIINESSSEVERRVISSCKNNTNAINGHKFIRPSDRDIIDENSWIVYNFPISLKSNIAVEQAIELVKISWKDDSWSKELSEFFNEHDLDFDTILFTDLDSKNIDSMIAYKYDITSDVEKLNKENKIPVVVVECSKSFMSFINSNKMSIIELSEKAKLNVIIDYLKKHAKRVYRIFNVGE
jgi:hypothetical protein